jgi:hypothetical protein
MDSEWDSVVQYRTLYKEKAACSMCIPESHHLNHTRTKLVCVRYEVKVLPSAQFQCEQPLVTTLVRQYGQCKT